MTDSEGDIVLETYTDRIEGVERPNIDITQVEITESNGIVTISLTVKGMIIISKDINYNIILYDGHKWTASISYNDGICKMEWTKNLEDILNETYLEATGVGTNTLFINFSLEEFGNPLYLYISRVNTFEYCMDEFNTFESYMDFIEPKPHEIPLKDNEIQQEDKSNESPGFAFLLIIVALIFIVLIYYAKKRH
jgi:hypothetical protein